MADRETGITTGKDDISLLFEEAGLLKGADEGRRSTLTGEQAQTVEAALAQGQAPQQAREDEQNRQARALATQLGLKFCDLSELSPDPQLINLFPRKTLQKYVALPVEREDGTIKMAVADPYDLQAQDELTFIANENGYMLETVLAEGQRLQALIQQLFTSSASRLDNALSSTIDSIEDEAEAAEAKSEFGTYASSMIDLDHDQDEAPIVRLINLIFQQALRYRASDIHFEAYEDEYRVRFRIDGVLKDVEKPPMRLKDSITARLKLLANMDLAEKRAPQDGRINVRMQGKDIDFRVSALPAIWGESIVLRLLDKSGVMLGLGDVGFRQKNIDLFTRIIRRPNGIILMTGPTGSGKTTTLYAALNAINTVDTKIITVEDPVEYQIDGINQCQVDRSVGLDFAQALRAMMRQAPNVILVGEMRDLETAETGISAALTGHLVFSTLHTNDAPSAATRLIEMGIKPFLVASSLQAVIAQRLVRKICKHCREPFNLAPEAIAEVGVSPEDYRNVVFYKGRGCEECAFTGYRGRTAIHEVMVLSEELREMILKCDSAETMRRKSREQGMDTLREDGWQKVLNGETTLEEVMRITQGYDG